MSEHRSLLKSLATDAPRQSFAARLLETTLDLLPLKVIIAASDGQILHANSTAAAMLAHGDPIWSRHGRLNAATSSATRALIAAIGSISANSARKCAGGTEVALPCRDGRAAMAHVRTLVPGATRLAQASEAAAAIFITEPHRVAPPLEALARLFDLTPSEVRVLAEIVGGRNRKEAAAALGVADSTVKSHLDRLFAKTGTSDQPSLFQLVTSLSWPTGH